MPCSLPALVLSLFASASPELASSAAPAAGQAPGSANAERAKMGLLPRRVARSRVTYLDGAAAPGKGAAVSEPFFAVLPDPPAADSPEVALAEAVPREGDTAKEAAAPESTPAPATATPPAAEGGAQPSAASGTPAAPAESSASESSAGKVKELERTIDPEGRVVVKVLGRDAAVLGEVVVCSLKDLPVLSSQRDKDGSVVQVVADGFGSIEVRRDSVGRFLAARPVDGAGRRAPAAD